MTNPDGNGTPTDAPCDATGADTGTAAGAAGATPYTAAGGGTAASVTAGAHSAAGAACAVGTDSTSGARTGDMPVAVERDPAAATSVANTVHIPPSGKAMRCQA